MIIFEKWGREIVLVASTNAFTLLSTLRSTKAIIEKYYDQYESKEDESLSSVMSFFISLLSKTSSIDVEKAVGQALVYLIDISYEVIFVFHFFYSLDQSHGSDGAKVQH